jgi:hypothetical protein
VEECSLRDKKKKGEERTRELRRVGKGNTDREAKSTRRKCRGNGFWVEGKGDGSQD